MEKKLTELTEVELKALAYDTIAQLQLHQNNLNVINQELSTRSVQRSSQVIPRLGTTEVV